MRTLNTERRTLNAGWRYAIPAVLLASAAAFAGVGKWATELTQDAAVAKIENLSELIDFRERADRLSNHRVHVKVVEEDDALPQSGWWHCWVVEDSEDSDFAHTWKFFEVNAASGEVRLIADMVDDDYVTLAAWRRQMFMERMW